MKLKRRASPPQLGFGDNDVAGWVNGAKDKEGNPKIEPTQTNLDTSTCTVGTYTFNAGAEPGDAYPLDETADGPS